MKTTREQFQQCADWDGEHFDTLKSYRKGTPIEFFKNIL